MRGRVAGGGYPPPAPTDPDMRNSRIRLLGSWIRYAYAHPRAAVSDDSPPAVGLALRRWLARWPVRLSARQPMIRSAASLRRVPWGRFPDFSGTTSELRLLAARPASLLDARRYHGFALFAPAGAGTPPGPGRTCMAAVRVPRLRWRRRDLPGSWATHRLHAPLSDPGGTGGARPVSAPSMVPSADVTASASTIRTISGLNHAACKAPCVRFAAGVAPGPRNTRFRLAGLPWPVRSLTCWVAEKVSVMSVHVLPPSPSFAWRKTSTSAFLAVRGRPRSSRSMTRCEFLGSQLPAECRRASSRGERSPSNSTCRRFPAALIWSFNSVICSKSMRRV